MPLSELSDRLDCLTSFSSQLVFVCTDKIKQQSKFVETYISQQDDQTDLALLTADELTPLAIYREKLFHQLIGQHQGCNFTLPLNQVLAALNQHEGPVLISIFQAEKLPTKLVKELWELVLQSRFANNKQHLNILLMGQSDWAEKTKNIIAANSKEKPILINSVNNHIDNHAGQQFNIEQAIQHSQQMDNIDVDAQKDHHKGKAVYKKLWVIAVICLVFLATFVGMLYWLYPNKIRDILATSAPEPQSSGLVISQQVESKVDDMSELLSPEQVAIETVTSTTKKTLLADSKASAIEQPAANTSTNSLQIDSVKVGAEDLVTAWNAEKPKLDTQPLNTSTITTPISAGLPDVQAIDLATLTSKNPPLADEVPIQITQLAPEIVQVEALTISNQATDYPVADIISAAPISAPLSTTATTVRQTKTQNTPASEIKDRSATLSTLPSNLFVIQLTAMSNFSLLKEYIEDENLSDSVWLYTTQRYGGNWYVLIYNQHFDTINQARQQISQLPSQMLKNEPFAKTMRQVQQEIANSQP
ncbi:DamX protein [Paraglaciecola aquimarina]|uniref:DamX protein n=1 Tax=Paraglaciecola aquimarina TaxID=1235557 RepID=A0ABU3SS25_9ALTE|nr:DamX protein [Paraglaciecola aquimarina]MDU0352794.1 DamX protein [Paraglaciecola aquimarina]